MRSALRPSSFSQARRHGCLIVYGVGLFNVYDVQRKRIEPATEHTEEYLCCRDSAVVTDRCEVDQIPLAIARRAWTHSRDRVVGPSYFIFQYYNAYKVGQSSRVRPLGLALFGKSRHSLFLIPSSEQALEEPSLKVKSVL